MSLVFFSGKSLVLPSVATFDPCRVSFTRFSSLGDAVLKVLEKRVEAVGLIIKHAGTGTAVSLLPPTTEINTIIALVDLPRIAETAFAAATFAATFSRWR